jgi:hypothetical protein
MGHGRDLCSDFLGDTVCGFIVNERHCAEQPDEEICKRLEPELQPSGSNPCGSNGQYVNLQTGDSEVNDPGINACVYNINDVPKGLHCIVQTEGLYNGQVACSVPVKK